MAANIAGRVGVRIPRGFIIRGSFLVLIAVKQSLHGVCLDGQGADDGNSKVATADWAYCTSHSYKCSSIATDPE